jgi:protein-L-isoaspartate O-methyltransferase
MEAMKQIDRADYVPQGYAPYADCPQPIGSQRDFSFVNLHMYLFLDFYMVLLKEAR